MEDHKRDVPVIWPVDPQHDVEISKSRIWIDGCFDFAHHGHAGAMLQARQLGEELLVGIHSDEEIQEHKGPTVMTLRERQLAVEACRWASKAIPSAPYVTSLPWISHYGCQFVVHGDDITSDSNGEDCYRFVKDAQRFLVVKRTPGISTTDLVGRMLLCTKNHFIPCLAATLKGTQGPGDDNERKVAATQMMQRIRDYASDESGLKPFCEVYIWNGAKGEIESQKTSSNWDTLVEGRRPLKDQRIVYVDGGFDLFASGHIEFLKCVLKEEEALAKASGWYDDPRHNYPPAYIVAGVHDDFVINEWKGLNYPIMNIFERGLCVLQCRYVQSLVFSVPFQPSTAFLSSIPFGTPDAVYHGPTTFANSHSDPYVDAKQLNIYREINNHDYQHVNAGEIVERIMKGKSLYEARQRAKLLKSANESQLANSATA